MGKNKTQYGQEVCECLEEYITDDRYHQAVLLDGPWGVGKTWFIKNIFIPQFQEAHKDEGWAVVFVSLYGLHDVVDLEAELERCFVKNAMSQLSKKSGIKFFDGQNLFKGVEILKMLSPLLSAYLPFKDLSKLKLEDISKVLPKPHRVVLFMDDLERTNIEPDAILGYINELTENEGTKVIVIGNEAELCNAHGIADKKEEGEKQRKNSSKKYRYDVNKEKAIGLNISYPVKMDEIYDLVVDRYVRSESLKMYFYQEKNRVVENFVNNESNNFRTLILALIACDKFYPILEEAYEEWKAALPEEDKVKSPKIFSGLVNSVIEFTVKEALVLEAGNKPPIPRGMGDGYIYTYSYRYKHPFVTSYIKNRRLEREKIKQHAKEVLDDLLDRNQEKNKAYNCLMNWRRRTDRQVEDALKEIKKEISQKRLTADYIKNLFYLLLGISRAGFTISWEVYVDAVIVNWERQKSPIWAKESLYYAEMEDKQMLDEYNQILQPIYAFAEAHYHQLQMEKYQFLTDNMWDSDFHEKCNEKRAGFVKNRKFLSYADPSAVVQKIKEASEEEITYFTEGIATMYRTVNSCDFFEGDIPTISAILKGIEEIGDFGGKIKTANVRILENLLKEKEKSLVKKT